MNYTQAQIDRANAVSLEDFLRTQGETLIKSGREYRWKEHDSLTVRGNKWFRHSQSKGGYPIDFVMEFYGKSFPEAVQLLTGESAEGQSEASTAPPTAFHLALSLLAALLVFLFDICAVLLTIASVILAVLGVALFFTPTPIGGIVFLFLAFLLSPYGLQAAAGSLLWALDGGKSALYRFLAS